MKALFPLFACAISGISIASAAPAEPLSPKKEEAQAFKACADSILQGFRRIANTRETRFNGKVAEATALCRGGQKSLQFRLTPWVDWSTYWGSGDTASLPKGFISSKGPVFRGVSGALLDLEYQRMELIKFNLFDNSGTYKTYISGQTGTG